MISANVFRDVCEGTGFCEPKPVVCFPTIAREVGGASARRSYRDDADSLLLPHDSVRLLLLEEHTSAIIRTADQLQSQFRLQMLQQLHSYCVLLRLDTCHKKTLNLEYCRHILYEGITQETKNVKIQNNIICVLSIFFPLFCSTASLPPISDAFRWPVIVSRKGNTDKIKQNGKSIS